MLWLGRRTPYGCRGSLSFTPQPGAAQAPLGGEGPEQSRGEGREAGGIADEREEDDMEDEEEIQSRSSG